MRNRTITTIVGEFVGECYSPIIDLAIERLEAQKHAEGLLDPVSCFTEHYIRQLACRAKALYDHYRLEVFEGKSNPYTIEERQEIMTRYLNNEDVSLYITTLAPAVYG